MDELLRIKIKLWAFQQDFVIRTYGENSVILTPFSTDALDEIYTTIQDAVPIIYSEIEKGDPEIFRFNPDLPSKTNPLSTHPLTCFIPLSFIQKLGLINYDNPVKPSIQPWHSYDSESFKYLTVSLKT